MKDYKREGCIVHSDINNINLGINKIITTCDLVGLNLLACVAIKDKNCIITTKHI